MELIKCEICWKVIENRSWARKVCSKCRKIKDKQLRKINDEKKKLLRLKNKQNEVSSNETNKESAVQDHVC